MRAQGLCVPFVRSAAEAIAPPLEEMADIQYNRAGISARDPATGVRHQISRLRNGEQRLTASGRRLLDADFVDFMIHVPTTEQQIQNADHPVDPTPRDTYRTFTESQMGNLQEMLVFHLRQNGLLPPGLSLL